MARQRNLGQKRRLQHQLEIQSLQIEQVFTRHEVEAQVAGGVVQAKTIRFNLQTLADGFERLRELKQELIAALRVPDVHLTRENGQWEVHVTRQNEPPVGLLELMALVPHLPPVTAVLGLAEEGNPILLNFADKQVTHVLVSGLSGAGKTALLRTMAISLGLNNRQSQLQMLVLDMETGSNAISQTALQPLNYLPHMLSSVVQEREHALEVLAFLTSEIAYRSQQNVITPTIVVYVDKIAALLEMGGATAVEAITQILQKGAKVGIHLILSTQRPHAPVLGNLLKSHISVRLIGKVQDEREARAASGLSGTQAEFLLGQGDFLAVTQQGVTHFQSAYMGDYDLHLCLEELHRRRPPSLVAQPYHIRPSVPSDSLPPDEVTDETGQFLFNGQIINFTVADFPVAESVTEEAILPQSDLQETPSPFATSPETKEKPTTIEQVGTISKAIPVPVVTLNPIPSAPKAKFVPKPRKKSGVTPQPMPKIDPPQPSMGERIASPKQTLPPLEMTEKPKQLETAVKPDWLTPKQPVEKPRIETVLSENKANVPLVEPALKPEPPKASAPDWLTALKNEVASPAPQINGSRDKTETPIDEATRPAKSQPTAVRQPWLAFSDGERLQLQPKASSVPPETGKASPEQDKLKESLFSARKPVEQRPLPQFNKPAPKPVPKPMPKIINPPPVPIRPPDDEEEIPFE